MLESMDMIYANQGELTFCKRDFVTGVQIQVYQEANLVLSKLSVTSPIFMLILQLYLLYNIFQMPARFGL